jgi:hypothetical protein
LLQRAGVAGFAVLTAPFADQVARAMAYQPADRPLPAVVLDHPVQMIDQDALRRRATQIADAVERLLDDRDP